MVPTLRDEIDRKVLATLLKLVTQYSSGEISAKECKVGVTTVWDVTAGLSSNEVNDKVAFLLNQL